MWRKTVQKKLSPRRRVFFIFFYAASMSRASWSKLGGGRLRRDCPELELARKLGWDWGRATGFRPQEKGRGVFLDCAWTRKPDCEEARLLAGLPEVLLPVRSVKC